MTHDLRRAMALHDSCRQKLRGMQGFFASSKESMLTLNARQVPAE